MLSQAICYCAHGSVSRISFHIFPDFESFTNDTFYTSDFQYRITENFKNAQKEKCLNKLIKIYEPLKII